MPELAMRYLTAADVAELSSADAQRFQRRVENSFRERINTSACSLLADRQQTKLIRAT